MAGRQEGGWCQRRGQNRTCELLARRVKLPEWTREEVLEFPGSVDGPWARYVHEPDAAGIGTVRYPRVVPRDEECAAKLSKRTLTNLYSERPAWLDLAHRRLDEAVFAAYGWLGVAGRRVDAVECCQACSTRANQGGGHAMGSVSVTSVGADLQIRLPDETAGRLGIQQGDEVAIEEEGGTLVIRLAGSRRRLWRGRVERARRPPADGDAAAQPAEANAATIELLQRWLEEDATDDPEEIRLAQQELDEFKQAINAERDRAGARRIYP